MSSPSSGATSPRRKPTQARSKYTVDLILDVAAEVLDRGGKKSYTTNRIAEVAGISIGSFYQYFSSKDAVTVALLEREASDTVKQIEAALAEPDADRALTRLIDVAVQHQLGRPQLARTLDDEQKRLGAAAQISASAKGAVMLIIQFFIDRHGFSPERARNVAIDLIGIIRTLTDAAGSRNEQNPAFLRRTIEGAVRGYLAACQM